MVKKSDSSRGGKGSSNRSRSSDGDFLTAMRERPYTTAAAAAGVAAAGAFRWARRGQIGEAVASGVESLNELKDEHLGSTRSQSEIAEEALTLKETGEQPSIPQSNQEAKAGAKAFS